MADSPNTTNPSSTRRAVLAGIAAAPAVALPTFAGASPDPVFTAMEAERAAYAEWKVASNAFDEAEGRWFELKHHFPNFIGLNLDGEITGAEGEYRMYESHTRIDAFFNMEEIVAKATGQAAINPERRAVAHESLRERLERIEAEREKLRIPALEEAADAALKTWCDAELAVMSTRPTTLKGALALLAFTRKFIEGGGSAEDIAQTLDGIEAFIVGGVNA